MARIELQGIAHSYRPAPAGPEEYALRSLDLVWEDGGAYALLGPSGCGKTTLLNIISGLVRPTQGRVLFDGRDVTDLPPQRRNIAQVFQFPVIYDTMTVYDNLAFPLRNRGVPETEVRARVHEIAEMLELSDNLRYRASGLGADAKQKISLGRGLVRSDVAAILFDEPLTVIDPHLKWILRRKLKQVHQALGLTLIYVTHDQTEALTFADEVVVMHEGRILQCGSPQELFERPAHTFVGHFVGSPGMNVVPCTLAGGDALVDGVRIVLPAGLAQAGRRRGSSFALGLRPEFLALTDRPREGAPPVALEALEDRGNYRIVTVRLGRHRLAVKQAEDAPLPRDGARLVLEPGHTRLYADGVLVG